MIKKLYAITDSVLMSGNQFTNKVSACLGAGCRLIQYRDKSNRNHPHRFQQAELLRKLCDQFEACLIINDDLALAKDIAADGVHLGQEDAAIRTAKASLPSNVIIGATCHNSLDLAECAVNDGASYLAFGRFFPSRTKPNASAADFKILHHSKQHYSQPVVAIGGITIENASKLIHLGVDAIAVCHDIFAADDTRQIEKKVKNYLRLFDN